MSLLLYYFVFFFNDTTTTEIYTYVHTLSLHDSLPISHWRVALQNERNVSAETCLEIAQFHVRVRRGAEAAAATYGSRDGNCKRDPVRRPAMRRSDLRTARHKRKNGLYSTSDRERLAPIGTATGTSVPNLPLHIMVAGVCVSPCRAPDQHH